MHFIHHLCHLKNVPTPVSFSFIFSLFKQTLRFLQQIYVKNVHPVYRAGIWTHDILNMSLLPQRLDQGSHPPSWFYFLQTSHISWCSFSHQSGRYFLMEKNLFDDQRWSLLVWDKNNNNLETSKSCQKYLK